MVRRTSAGEGQAVVLELDDGCGGLAAHVLDGVLVLLLVGCGRESREKREKTKR